MIQKKAKGIAPLAFLVVMAALMSLYCQSVFCAYSCCTYSYYIYMFIPTALSMLAVPVVDTAGSSAPRPNSSLRHHTDPLRKQSLR